MPFLNESNLFTVQQLDLENKLILPTSQLLDRIVFKSNMLYQDIHNVLINTYTSAAANVRQILESPLEKMMSWYDQAAASGAELYTLTHMQLNQLYQDAAKVALKAHSQVATAAKQIYEHPKDTATAWYQQASHESAGLVAKMQAEIHPVYQQLHVNISKVKDNTIQDLQTFLDHPQQTTIAVLEPVTRNAAAVIEQAEKNLLFLKNSPEQFLASAFTPVTNYLSTQTESTKTALLNSYSTLVDLTNLLASQPNAAFHAIYNKTLSALLDVYFTLISSLLVAV
jgi:hypothetical protein